MRAPFTHAGLALLLVSLPPLFAQTGAPSTQSDGIFDYRVSLNDIGGMTAAGWTISVKGEAPVRLLTFTVSYLCADDSLDVVEQELRDLVAPGREAKLPGDYYVCINHGPVKGYDVTRISIDQLNASGVPNTLQCSDGREVTYTVEHQGGSAFRLRRRDGGGATLNADALTEVALSEALCGQQAQAPAGIITKLRALLFERLRNEGGTKTTAPGVRG